MGSASNHSGRLQDNPSYTGQTLLARSFSPEFRGWSPPIQPERVPTVDRLTDRDKLTARDRSGDAQSLDIQQSFGRTSSDVAPGRFTRLYRAVAEATAVPLSGAAATALGVATRRTA